MAWRLLPVALVLAVALADVAGRHELAFDALLLAVPVIAWAGLETVAAHVDGEVDRLQAIFWGLVLALVVVGAASRAPVAGHAHVPALARTTLVLAIALFCVHAAAGVVGELRGRREPLSERS